MRARTSFVAKVLGKTVFTAKIKPQSVFNENTAHF